jgi:hypothetical protein
LNRRKERDVLTREEIEKRMEAYDEASASIRVYCSDSPDDPKLESKQYEAAAKQIEKWAWAWYTKIMTKKGA